MKYIGIFFLLILAIALGLCLYDILKEELEPVESFHSRQEVYSGDELSSQADLYHQSKKEYRHEE